MDMTKEIPEAIQMICEDEEWVQTLDYDQIPFRCKRCHGYDHLFRDCPMNHPKNATRKEEENKDQGFTRVSSRKRGGRKQENREVHKKRMVSNKFEILKDLPEDTMENQIEGR